MPRQQMICVVTPGAPAAVGPRVERVLAAFAERIGRIHFATLAELPPPPDAPEGQAPELLLEVVVDEDLALADLLDLALARAFGALWRLYRPNWPGLPGTDRATRRAWLRAFLLAHASLPECGFVGARDRSVAQVREEHRLFQAARAAVQGLPASHRPADAAALA
ncbi:hypothetical protein, partial [Ottowia sp.]|uniref:hypothetical protein n=1 Tax=Ottowia sp. TaxID=1898956 RepID=UPI0039E25ACC